MYLTMNPETRATIDRFEALSEADKRAALEAAGIPLPGTLRFAPPRVPTVDEQLVKLSGLFHTLSPAQRSALVELAKEYHGDNERTV